MRPILVVDSMNLFIRAYSACPDMSSQGHQVGGTVGFLRTLKKLFNEIQPSEAFLVWEGGGSRRRKSLFSEYKENRRPEKLNRFYEDDIPDSEENRQHQLVTLIGLLKHMPLRQLYVSDCEGDDVIAYLSRGPLKGQEKIIASSDKDMYQLLDDFTNVYSFHKKRVIRPLDVEEEFRITPSNFALAKSLCGDPSDNIPGIQGVGFRTLVKRFPFLGTENDITLQHLKDYCHTHLSESVIYGRVLENWDTVIRNWKLIYLDVGCLSHEQIKRIETQLGTTPPPGDRMAMIRGLLKEGVGDFDVESLFYSTHCLTSTN